MICPHCNENTAHRSHRNSIKDRFYRLARMIPFRCHKCSTRFYAYRAGAKSDKLRTREERKIIELRRKIKWRRSKGTIAAYTAAGLVLAMTLYFMLQQTIHSE